MNVLVKQAYELAVKVREKAYTPYSGFKVGAVIVTADDYTMFSGCNVENASFGATICAERNAVLSAVADKGIPVPYSRDSFSFLVVVADTAEPTPPCAQCLQMLAEFCPADFPVYLGNLNGITSETTFGELLPFPFNGSPLQIES